MTKVTKNVNSYLFAVIAVVIILAGASAIISNGLTTTNTTVTSVFSNSTAAEVNSTLNATPLIYTTMADTGTLNFTAQTAEAVNVSVYLNGDLVAFDEVNISRVYEVGNTSLVFVNGRNNLTFEADIETGKLNITNSKLIITNPVDNTLAPLYAVLLALIPLGLIIGTIYVVYKKKYK